MRIINLSSLNMETWIDPQYLVVYTTQVIPPELLREIQARFPRLTILGVSSYHGVFSPDGFRRGSYGFLMEGDEHFDLAPLAIDFSSSSNPRLQVRETLTKSRRPNMTPHTILMHAIRGYEERIIEGIHDVYDQSVQIFGSTAAHDKFLDYPFVFLGETFLRQGVVLTLVYSDQFMCSITSGGYLPTQNSGTITAAQGRTLLTIDARPAAEVYNEWTHGLFEDCIRCGGELPRSAALYPFGRPLNTPSGTDYWLSHPRSIHSDLGSIELYSEPEPNTTIILTRGNVRQLILHAGNVVRQALAIHNKASIVAAFVMYCAGCTSIIAENMPQVCREMQNALGDIPFLGCTSHGEQGRIAPTGRDSHGNMMVVLVLIKASR